MRLHITYIFYRFPEEINRSTKRHIYRGQVQQQWHLTSEYNKRLSRLAVRTRYIACTDRLAWIAF